MRTPGAVVVAAQRRFVARRRAGRRRTARPFVVTAAVLVTLAAAGWLLANSSLVGVRTVTVEGTSRLSVQQVLRAAGIHSGTSLIRLDPGSVARKVAVLPAVQHAVVSRDWPHGVVITVTERVPAAVVHEAAGVVLLDRAGVAFASQPQAPAGLVDVQLSAPVPGPGAAAARAAMQVVGALPTGVRRRVATVDAPSPYAVTLVLRNGRHVVWGSAAASRQKAAVLHTLLRRKAQVIDVSTPDVVVTR